MTIKTLKQFCGDDDTREILKQPSSQDDWTWATDGRMVVRVPRMADVPEVERYPKCSMVFGQYQPDGDWQPLPKIPPQESSECSCSKCHGSGECRCKNCQCKHLCGVCDGSGQITVTTKTVIGKRSLNDFFLRKLALLPKIEVNTSGDNPESPMSFRFDGGCGLLMPMSEKQ